MLGRRIGHVNGNGLADVALLDDFDTNVFRAEAMAGSVSIPSILSAPLPGPTGLIAIADLVGDGALDLVAANF